MNYVSRFSCGPTIVVGLAPRSVVCRAGQLAGSLAGWLDGMVHVPHTFGHPSGFFLFEEVLLLDWESHNERTCTLASMLSVIVHVVHSCWSFGVRLCSMTYNTQHNGADTYVHTYMMTCMQVGWLQVGGRLPLQQQNNNKTNINTTKTTRVELHGGLQNIQWF